LCAAAAVAAAAAAGHVITNYHVITDASDIQVTFMGGAEYSAKVIGVDQDKDVAVLKVGAQHACRVLLNWCASDAVQRTHACLVVMCIMVHLLS
jgi:S1-C subfamily serine protease